MKKDDFLKLMIGMYITDHQDTESPANYSRIVGFKGTLIQPQPYERYNVPTNAHPYWIDYREINITQKLFASEYYALCRL